MIRRLLLVLALLVASSAPALAQCSPQTTGELLYALSPTTCRTLPGSSVSGADLALGGNLRLPITYQGATLLIKDSMTWGGPYIADSNGTGGYIGILGGFHAVADEAGTTYISYLQDRIAASGIDLDIFRDGGGQLKLTATAVSVEQGHLTFGGAYGDNTQDIGAAGTTRPRIGYFGTGLNVAGSAGLTTTKTVRAAGGLTNCTLIFTGGILTGGSC